MRLIITRHGETEENIEGITQGHLPGTLSKLGKEQAKKLALRLKKEKFDVIFSSDLKRAKDTTKEILKYHKVPVFYTKELRERNHGEYEGKKRAEYLHKVKGSHYFSLDGKPKGGESFREMGIRVKKFLNKTHKRYFGKKVLIVGHGGINIVLRTVLLKKPLDSLFQDKVQGNTGIDIFEIDEEKNPKVILINYIKHLK